MTEVIIFLIAFTAAALAIGMIALAFAYYVMTKNYQEKHYPDKKFKKEGES